MANKVHHFPTEEKWAKFRDILKKLKSKIKETKTAFYEIIFSSKNCKRYMESNT